MRCAFGPRVSRRPDAYRTALLHEFGIVGIHQDRPGKIDQSSSSFAPAGGFTFVSFQSPPAGTKSTEPAQNAAAMSTTKVRQTEETRFKTQRSGSKSLMSAKA